MDLSFRNRINKLRAIRLTQNEKKAIRSRLAAYLEQHPVQQDQNALILHRFTFKFSYVAMALILTVVLSSTGISYAAEGAVPGDLLYPVKVDVLEPLHAAVVLTPTAKLQWEVTKVDRRLKEAEALIQRDSLSPAISTNLSQRVQNTANTIDRHIASLKANDNFAAAAGATSALSAILQAHAEVLTHLATHNSAEHQPTALLSTIISQTQNLQNEQNDLVNEVSQQDPEASHAAASSLYTTTEKNLSKLRSLYASRVTGLATSTQSALQDYFSQIDALTNEGQNKLTIGSSSDAFLLSQEAHRKIEEAKRLLNVQQRLNGSSRIKIKETIVPTVTPELAEPMLPAAQAATSTPVYVNTRKSQSEKKSESNTQGHSNADRGTRLQQLLPKNVHLDDLELDFGDKKD